MADLIDHPAHYVDGRAKAYEPIEVIEAWELGYHLGQVLKYVSRYRRKPSLNPINDLRKAQWYLERFIKNELKAEEEDQKDTFNPLTHLIEPNGTKAETFSFPDKKAQ